MFEAGDLGLQGPPQLQDPSFLSSTLNGQNKDDNLDLSFLPDELATQEESSVNTPANVTQDSGIFQDYRPEETAAEGDPTKSMPGASPFCPMTPMTPMTPVAESSGIIPMLQWVM